MSLKTPTTQETSDLIVAGLEASLNQTIPLFPKAFNRVLAKVLAGVFQLLYKYGGFIFLQQFVQTASAKDTTIFGVVINPLKFWGRLIGVGDPVAATQAELLIDITVTTQGGTLASGTQLTSQLNGVTYLTVGAVSLNAASVQATIRAASDQNGGGGAGTIGNLDTGDIVTFANPLGVVARDAAVNTQIVTGAEGETTDVYRQKIIDRFQQRPQGGALADYKVWGEEVPGITDIFPYTGAAGQVDVYAEATPASSGNPDGIPTQAQLDAVAESIQLDENGLASRRPVGAFVNTLPITRRGFDTRVTDLVVDNPGQVQTNVTAAVEEYYANAEPFIDGLAIPPRLDRLTRSALIGVVGDVVAAANGTFTTVEFNLTGVPGTLELYVLQQGELVKSSGVAFS